jgi:hypothetical protein
VDTALVPFPERDAQKAAVQQMLDSALGMETCVDLASGEIDVSLRNVAAGHHFPSGAAFDRRLWIELRAFRNGDEILTSGVVATGQPVTNVGDPDLVLIRDETFARDGTTPARMFWDVARIVPRGILPVPTFDSPSNDTQTFHYVPHGLTPDRVAATVWLEPIGLDVLDDLAASESSGTGGIAPLRDAMPRWRLGAGRRSDAGADRGVSLEWTLDEATALCADGTLCHVTRDGKGCLRGP